MVEQAGADQEIEITPEMVAAGVEAFLSFDERFESEAVAVVRVLEAMLAASRAPAKVAMLAPEVERSLSPYRESTGNTLPHS